MSMENITTDIQTLVPELNVVALITFLSLIPLLLVSLTTFTRNIIVFSFLRHALGLQQSPPNIVLIVLSLILVMLTMTPVFKSMYQDGIEPYRKNQVGLERAVVLSWTPLREFLVSQTYEEDIAFIYDISRIEKPNNIADVEFQYLISGFILSELKLAFKIGFLIFLPFLLIDMVIAAMLTALGMIMVPPITISLPIKVMLFVVIDGWELITQVLVSSALN